MSNTKLSNKQKAKLRYAKKASPVQVDHWGVHLTKEGYVRYIKNTVQQQLGNFSSEVINNLIKEGRRESKESRHQ